MTSTKSGLLMSMQLQLQRTFEQDSCRAHDTDVAVTKGLSSQHKWQQVNQAAATHSG